MSIGGTCHSCESLAIKRRKRDSPMPAPSCEARRKRPSSVTLISGCSLLCGGVANLGTDKETV